ncbi:AsnC family protein [Salmonella enterica subsp. enterica]|nr:AsnC family protein [Salmonella enterica subsp. enterica serovar Lattenkamp]EBU9480044.1 AsnC family protein [Salmonella enterica subsp. enterica serovar Monschaui]EBV5831571.1 AsnC family protein [Salmonella enterica subsp. enterica serovar Carmel]EBV8484032.1 AsnC family protein [Salmonella enterica subsp. enterica serovar Ago]ECN0519216.1 AsnC family protein [Salmonella enterica subsp. enterica serovar Montevideo]ECQ6295735.1 AsnC family protein [Salmonella enterica subsp. enterica serov
MILPPMGVRGRCPAHVKAWTQAEDEQLMGLYATLTIDNIATLLNRTRYAVYVRASLLRQRYPERLSYKAVPFSQREDAFIRQHARTMTCQQMADCLGRSADTIRYRANLIGASLVKCGDLFPRTQLPDSDVKLIRALRDDPHPRRLTFREIGEKFGISGARARNVYWCRRTAEDVILRELLP